MIPPQSKSYLREGTDSWGQIIEVTEHIIAAGNEWGHWPFLWGFDLSICDDGGDEFPRRICRLDIVQDKDFRFVVLWIFDSEEVFSLWNKIFFLLFLKRVKLCADGHALWACGQVNQLYAFNIVLGPNIIKLFLLSMNKEKLIQLFEPVLKFVPLGQKTR